MVRISWVLTVIFFATHLCGCTPNFRAVRSLNLGQGVDAQALTADYRVITSQAKIGQITCAEPSPDIARVFSQALSATASGATEAGTSVSGAFQFQTAQAIAELGKRTATIQLLRDVLHGECQAYANGLITKAEYAFKLSRFDGLAVTLMAIEMESAVASTLPDTTVSSPSLSLSVQPNGQISATSTKSGSGGATTPGDSSTSLSGAGKTTTGSSQESSDSLAQAAKAVTDAKTAAALATKDIGTVDSQLKAEGAKAAAADKKAASALDAIGKDLTSALDSLSAAFLQVATDASATDSVLKAMTAVKTNLGTLTSGQAKQSKVIEAASIAPVATANSAVSDAVKSLTAAQTAIQSIVDAQNAAKLKTTMAGASPKAGGSGLSDQQALAIRDIHETYLELQNMIPLQIACVQAMDAPPTVPDATDTAFRAYCVKYATSIFGPVAVPASSIGNVSTQPRESSNPTLPALPPNRSYVFGPITVPNEQLPAPAPNAPPPHQ